MTDTEVMYEDTEVMYEDFVACRRSGRRNAVLLVDAIANQGVKSAASASATVLSHDLASLSVHQSGDKGDDPKKSQDPTAEEDEEEEHF